MPRSDKKTKIKVIRCKETNKIIKVKRIYNAKGGNAVDVNKAVGRTFNPNTRKHELKFGIKDERHSS